MQMFKITDMSLRVDKPQKQDTAVDLDEPMIRWMDDVTFDIDSDTNSISDEEDVASGSDFERNIRVKNIQEIWQCDDVWNNLMVGTIYRFKLHLALD